MDETRIALGEACLGCTLRQDAWWTEIVPAIILLTAFGVYATWRAFEGVYYWADPYLTPFYSPLIDPQHHWWPFSPALLILAGPLGFRVTCYYYRKAYYRAFFLDPPACGVGERPHRHYRGETSFPLIWQNIHRYFFYIAVVFLAFLWHDVVRAFFFPDGVGVGLGTLIMVVNIVLLTAYVCSCHSCRHLVGGRMDSFEGRSTGGISRRMWQWVSALNERHMLLAWSSLISVGLTDFYIRLCASGAIHDPRLL